MTIGHAIASIGLLVISCFKHDYLYVAGPLALGATFGAITRINGIYHDKKAIEKVEDYR